MQSVDLQAIAEFKKGKVEYRVDKTGIVHVPFGKVNFEEDDLLENLLATIVSCIGLKMVLCCGLTFILTCNSLLSFRNQ